MRYNVRAEMNKNDCHKTKRTVSDPTQRNVRIVGAALLVLALAWQHVQATRLGYQVERARRQSQGLKGRVAALQMQLESRLSPAELARLAETRLSLEPASPESVRRLADAPLPGPHGGLLGRLLPRSWTRLLGRV